jgi:hypothetical protein
VGRRFNFESREFLREPGVSYLIDFGPKNDDIGAENGYFWNNNYSPDIS